MIGKRSKLAGLNPDDPGYAAAAAGYIDRDGVAETNFSSFGNIAPTIEERIAFWHAVENSERCPATHKFTVNPGIDEEFWNFVEQDQHAPDLLKNIAETARDAIFVKDIKENKAAEIYEYFLTHRTALKDEAQTISVAPGRGGRVQTRIVLELPADMNAQQRLEIAQRFCQEQFEKRDVPYHCAIHRPTKLNDERNFHMHITFHDRPSKRMVHPDTGIEVWDFEITELKRDCSRHYVETHPKQQKKVREFQELKWPKQVRKSFAYIVNDVRKKAGKAPLYDPRNYKEMGIEVEAVPSLTRKEFHDIQRGIANPEAAAKIEKRWERAMIKAAEETLLAVPDKAISARFRDLIAKVTTKAPTSIVMTKAAHGCYIDAIRRVNEARLDRTALKVAVEREISGLIPEIGSASAAAKKAKVEIELIHDHLAKPLHHAELLARESERLAVAQLVLHENQLRTKSPGSLSLPGRSFSTLAAAAGLSGLSQILQSQNNEIRIPVPTQPQKQQSPITPMIGQPTPKSVPFVAETPIQIEPKPEPIITPTVRKEWIDPLSSWRRGVPRQNKAIETPSAPPSTLATTPQSRNNQKPTAPNPVPPRASKIIPTSPMAPTKTPPAIPTTGVTSSIVNGLHSNPKTTMRGKRIPIPQPKTSTAEQFSQKDSSSATIPKNPITDPKNTTPFPTPEFKPITLNAEANAIALKEKARRERRRALLTKPKRPPTRTRGGRER